MTPLDALVVLAVLAVLNHEFLVSTVVEDLSIEEDPVIWRMLQSVAVPLLGNVCHVFMNGLNRVQVMKIS